MSSGLDMLSHVRSIGKRVKSGEVWVDVFQKLDLGKLTPKDLISAKDRHRDEYEAGSSFYGTAQSKTGTAWSLPWPQTPAEVQDLVKANGRIIRVTFPWTGWLTPSGYRLTWRTGLGRLR